MLSQLVASFHHLLFLKADAHWLPNDRLLTATSGRSSTKVEQESSETAPRDWIYMLYAPAMYFTFKSIERLLKFPITESGNSDAQITLIPRYLVGGDCLMNLA